MQPNQRKLYFKSIWRTLVGIAIILLAYYLLSGEDQGAFNTIRRGIQAILKAL